MQNHIKNKLRLGVNIDHIATVRQARRTTYPDPVHAAQLAESAGADGITLHLREDRRHIQDDDVFRLKEIIKIPINLEMAATAEMLEIAKKVLPENCCLVPEKRTEITTEGGLDAASGIDYLKKYCAELAAQKIAMSLFIDPDFKQIDAALAIGVPVIELHTGAYADAKTTGEQEHELIRLQQASAYAHQQGLIVNAGHGLTRQNVGPIAAIPELHELNIGHAIIADACCMGMAEAVCQMKAAMMAGRAV